MNKEISKILMVCMLLEGIITYINSFLFQVSHTIRWFLV